MDFGLHMYAKKAHIPTATTHINNTHTEKTQRKALYLDYFVQDPLLSLILAIAEETVCVDIVRVTIQFDMQVVRPLKIVLDCKGNLCRCSTKVHGSHCLCPFWAYIGVPQVFLQI